MDSILIALMFVLSVSALFANPQYKVQPLEMVRDTCFPDYINEDGDVAGTAFDATDSWSSCSVYWEKGRAHVLDTPSPVFWSSVNGVNDKGQVVGSAAAKPGYQSLSLFWSKYGSTVINSAGNNAILLAYGINNSSQIAGESLNLRPCVWAKGVISELSNTCGRALCINNSGQVAGVMYDGVNRSRFVTWRKGVIKNILVFQKGEQIVERCAINDDGQIVGSYWKHDKSGAGNCISFIWDRGTLINLGTLYGKDSSVRDLNDRGQAVGQSDGAAFIWENGVMKDLNYLIDPNSDWFIVTANAINNRGQIAATAIRKSDGSWGYPLLLTPAH